ncbi:MAG: NUDIX domain-containing protein [Candidatus Heimdallarchaeota archaeon]|nr:NUDIX domain-containing protein [Candidatus Heimdallarchaeota archaeon]
MQNQIIVVAGMIAYNDTLLIVQRSLESSLEAGKWEFPGGKVEFAESPEDALKREIMEELNLEIQIDKLFAVSSGMLSNDLHAVMLVYCCSSSSDSIILKDGNQYKWEHKTNLSQYEWAILDIPIIAQIQ